MKKETDEKLDNFCNTIQKLPKKKKRLINTFMRKLSMDTQNSKMIGINFVFNLEKKVLLILIFISKFNKSFIDIAIIGANPYYTASKLTRPQVFATFIRKLEFKAAKRLSQKLI